MKTNSKLCFRTRNSVSESESTTIRKLGSFRDILHDQNKPVDNLKKISESESDAITASFIKGTRITTFFVQKPVIGINQSDILKVTQ